MEMLLQVEEYNLTEIKRKKRAADRNRYKIEEEIIGLGEVNGEEASRLCALYVARWVEYMLYIEDHEFIRKSGHGNLFHQNRLEAESVLFLAQSGDYRQIKQYITTHGKRAMAGYSDRNRLLGERLISLAESIDDFGAPFMPPQPSWLVEEEVLD